MDIKKYILLLILTFSFLSITFTNISFAQKNKEYVHLSSFDGTEEKTDFSEKDLDMADAINYLITLAAVSIVILIIFRVTQGAFIKGTFDSIPNQMKGNDIIKNAGLALIIFIFSFVILSFINPSLLRWTVNILPKNSQNNLSNSSNQDLTCNPTNIYTNTNIEAMIRLDEDMSNTVYLDSLGYPSIGIGFNLERDSQEKVINYLISKGDVPKEVAEDLVKNARTYAKNKDKTISLTNEQINKLFEEDLKVHKEIAINYAGGEKAFNSHPENIQKVLIDMAFNLGNNINDFTKLKTALNNENYDDVAKEIVNSKYCSQVGNRCDRLANLASPTYCETMIKNAQEKNFYNNEGRCAIINSIKESDLKTIQGNYKLVKDKADKFLEMEKAAKADGITLIVISAYRDDDRQIAVCQETCGKPFCTGTTLCAKACKLGGNGSNHSTGDAIDLQNGCSNGSSYTKCMNNEVYKWMEKNGGKYGFIQSAAIKNSDAIHYSSTGN